MEKYDLTFSQQNIWLLEKMYNNSNVNSITGIIEIKKEFYEEFCNRAIQSIIKNNDAMRINIVLEKEKPYQIITNYVEEKIKLENMEDKSYDEIQNYVNDFKNKSININSKKLYEFEILKYSKTSGAILLKMHHIISDAWSYSKIIEQFTKEYGLLKSNQEILDEKVTSYIEFINSMKEYKDSDKYVKDEEFFDEYFKDLKSATVLKDRVEKISNTSKRYNIRLNEDINKKILDYCKKNKISPYVLFLTALSTYIYRIKDSNDFVIGSPSLNRANFKEKQIIGMFVATLPLRIKIEENVNFLELAHSISSNTMNVFRHQRYPYINVLKKIRNEKKISDNLYNIVLSYQNARANYDEKGEYSTKWYPNDFQNEDLIIHILDMDSTGILEINYDYLSELFEDIEIEYLHTRLMAIIENAILDEKIDVENIEIMSKEEKNKILYEFNNTKSDYPKDKSVIDLFEEQVIKTPDNIALVFEDKKLTYKELNEKANAVAHYLVARGVIENDKIAIFMKRSDRLIISLLAILKCRATYIPLDTAYPRDRIKNIINNSNSKYILCGNDKLEYSNNIILDNDNINIIYLNYSKENLDIKLSVKENINYIIFTSGSTGTPKGVEISNINLLNFVIGINKVLNISSTDKILSITTVSFDIFGLEMWCTLVNGATLNLANYIQSINGSELNIFCIVNKVNIMQCTPTKFGLLLDSNNNMFLKQMDKIILGGEQVPKNFVDRLKTITSSKIFDAYGPTETTIWSTIGDITSGIINSGKPISNTQIYILDKKKRMLPIQTQGELVICGLGVSSGYINNLKETKKRFEFDTKSKNKLYYTGDICSIDFKGNLKVFDRIDLQIKINGQRIELQEIEKKISEYKNINNDVVIKKNNRLICFYNTKNDDKIDNNEIIKFLYSKLPIYMVPKEYYLIKDFPLTLNGKIDRKEFNNINLINFKKNKSKVLLPINELQDKIYKIWKKVIKGKEFGVNDQFFELGTDSLDAIKIQVELLKSGIKIEYQDLFKYPTIIELEKKINSNKNLLYDKKDNNFKESFEKLNYDNILLKNKYDNKKPLKREVRNILLTGVTGFLGVHILDQYMKFYSGKIYCFIRNKENKNFDLRLKERLNFYFGTKYDKYINDRIIPIKADITNENKFGLTEDEFYNVFKDIDLVIHTAACVKHYGFASYFKKINIDGTNAIAKMCYENNKKLIHISTTSVSGNAFGTLDSENSSTKNNFFDETCFYNNQDLENIYTYTKFKAEKIILDYMNKGLHANIIRIGNLTNRYSDMKFQYNYKENAFANRIKSFIKIRKISDNIANLYLEFTPVDSAAEAIIRILGYFNDDHNVFHIYDNNYVSIKEFINILKSINIDIKVISQKDFDIVINKIANSDKMSDLNGLIPDFDKENRLNYDTHVDIKCDYTVRYLNYIGFKWPKIDSNYIVKYVHALT